jgi:hypothetical protein
VREIEAEKMNGVAGDREITEIDTRRESYLLNRILQLSKEIELGHKLLRLWKSYELYPGQIRKQAELAQLAMDRGLFPSEK